LTLIDEEYRVIQYFKRIINNNSFCSMYEVDNFLHEYYSDLVYVEDTFNSSITYHFPTQDERLATILLSEKLLPRPTGCTVDIVYY
jgi:hypothetical protein